MLTNEKHEALAQAIAAGTKKTKDLPKQMSRENVAMISDRAFEIANDDGLIQIGGGFKAIAPDLLPTITARQIIVAQDLRVSADLIEEFGSDPATMGYGATAGSAMINCIKKMISNCCSHNDYGLTKSSVKEDHPDLIVAIQKMILAAEDGSESKNRKRAFGNEIEAVRMLIASGPKA